MRLFTFAATVCIASFVSTAAVAGNCDEDKELKTLALNIYHEARGEPDEGKRMVGEVTLNRVASKYYPDTVCDVVYQRSQFSWVSTKKNTSPREKAAWEDSLEIAEELLSDGKESYDHLATHFLNPRTLKSKPSWSKKFKKVDEIGNHVFYRM